MLTLAFLTSPQDWLIVLAIVLLLFGGTKIPQLFRGVGQGLGEFKKGLEESKTDATSSTETKQAPNP